MRRLNNFLCHAAFMLFFLTCQDKNSDNQALPIAADYLKAQYSSFSDDSTIFVKAFVRAKKNSNSSIICMDEQNVQAGIIAHHLFIADLIAEYFLKISATTNSKRIILMGPNHRSRGKIPISTSLLTWKTPFGTVETHRSTIRSIISSGVAKINDDAFLMEHSIGALMPFIKLVFPDAAIVPLVLLSNTSESDCDRLSDFLVKHLDDKTLLLASIDFSHYKTAAEAALEDSLTFPIIQELDFERANDAFVCSRATLRVLLRTLKKMGQMEGEVVHHTNSGIISGQIEEPCTSYINMIWKQHSDHNNKKLKEHQKQITFLFGGDILIHPSIARSAYSSVENKYIFDNVFVEITHMLRKADIVVANLKGTFAGNDFGISFFPKHNYPDELAVALSNAGFTTISLANNHAADTGCSGLKRTYDVLFDNGIEAIGLRSNKRLKPQKFREIKYSILSYTYGTNYKFSNDWDIKPAIINFEIIKGDIIHSQKAGAQIVIVLLHCGIEYQTEVEPWLKELVNQIAIAGADAVICTHPHVIRPWEWIQVGTREVFAHYSLGNLLSSHADSLYNQGELVRLSFEKVKKYYYLKDVDILKVRTKNSTLVGEKIKPGKSFKKIHLSVL